MKRRPALPSFDAPEPVMRSAGAWLAQRDRGFTRAEAKAFNAWVDAHPAHAAAVAQLEQTMSVFDRLRELEPPGGRVDRDALAPHARIHSPVRWRLPALMVAGMAAIFAVMVFSIRQEVTSSTWRYATGSGGYERAALIDGSSVELNADTLVEVAYSASGRHVRLIRGEAHFHVAKDPRRPFVVEAQTVAVRAVGTAFNVRFAPTGVEVLVTEGRVRVAPAAPASTVSSEKPEPRSKVITPPEAPLLTAGHRMLVPTVPSPEPAQIAMVGPEEIERSLAWQPRVAVFGKTPLSVAVAEFNRQNRQQLVIGDRKLDTLLIGGNFRADQPDAFVRLLEASFGIRAERSETVITLRQAPLESP
jgi:transmembrane sensor